MTNSRLKPELVWGEKNQVGNYKFSKWEEKRRAHRLNELQAELMIKAGQNGQERLVKLVQEKWMEKDIPDAWHLHVEFH